MIYVLSDVHGNYKAWKNMLNLINFSKDDTLYVLGDVIDRGTAGIPVLEEIMNTNNIHMLMGNHEYMMLECLGLRDLSWCKFTVEDALRQWFANGGNVTYAAYRRLPTDEQDRIKEFMTSLPLSYKVTVKGQMIELCHSCPPGLYDEHQDQLVEPKEYYCVWDRNWMSGWDVDHMVIFGHTPTCNLDWRFPMSAIRLDNKIDIDCGAAYGAREGGRLCCICLDDMSEWYVDEYNQVEKKEVNDVTKLPRMYRGDPYTTGDAQDWTYEYTYEDLETVLRKLPAGYSAVEPSYYTCMQVGVLDWFYGHPEKLQNYGVFKGQRTEDIQDTILNIQEQLLGALKLFGYVDIAFDEYKKMVDELNKRESE